MQVRDLRRQMESCRLEEEGGRSRWRCRPSRPRTCRGGDKKGSAGKVYKLYLAKGEKVILDISTIDGRMAAIEKVVGKEGVGDRKV